jgi:hypothetical protein
MCHANFLSIKITRKNVFYFKNKLNCQTLWKEWYNQKGRCTPTICKIHFLQICFLPWHTCNLLHTKKQVIPWRWRQYVPSKHCKYHPITWCWNSEHRNMNVRAFQTL